MNRTLEIGGLGTIAKLSRVVAIPTDRNLIHFEHLPNGTWRILHTQSTFPNLSQVTEFKVIRDGDQRYIELVGLDTRLELISSTCVNVRHGYIHLDEITEGYWRLVYSSALIPDFTKVTSLIIHSEEDVL